MSELSSRSVAGAVITVSGPVFEVLINATAGAGGARLKSCRKARLIRFLSSRGMVWWADGRTKATRQIVESLKRSNC